MTHPRWWVLTLASLAATSAPLLGQLPPPRAEAYRQDSIREPMRLIRSIYRLNRIL